MSALKAFLVIGRWEYMIGTGFQAGIAALLGLRGVAYSQRLMWLALVGLLVWWLSHWIGAQINCLADYDGDKLYKNGLSHAVDVLGRRNIKRIIAIEIVSVSITIFLLSGFLGRWVLSGLWFAGLSLAFAYSVPPIRTKSKGLLNPVTLSLILFICPSLFVYHLLSSTFDIFSIVVISIYAAQAWSLFLVDQVSDYEEDKALEILTPCVIFGRYKVSLLALSIYSLTSTVLIGYFFTTHPPTHSLTYLVYSVAGICCAKVMIDFYHLSSLSLKFEQADRDQSRRNLEERLKRQVVTPAWLILTDIVVISLVFSRVFLEG